MKNIITLCFAIFAGAFSGFSQNFDLHVCVETACDGAPIGGVQLSPYYLPGDTIFPMPDSNGCYVYHGLPSGTAYLVAPGKNDDALNGVNAMDLVLVSRHILGIQPLPSPYSLMAADVNMSGSITAFDIVESRKLILGIYTQFPNNGVSWRFVDADFTFPNPQNPFQSLVPGTVTVPDFWIDSVVTVSFKGIKTGDVDCSAIPAFAPSADDREAVALTIPDARLQRGEVVDLPMRLGQAGEWSALQSAFYFDPELLEIQSVTPGSLPGMDTSDFALSRAGALNMVWFDIVPQQIGGGENLVTVRVRALAPVRVSDAISLSATGMLSEIFSEAGTSHKIQLEFTDSRTVAENGITGIAFQPNPTQAGTTISLRLAGPETVSVSLTDLSGRIVWTDRRNLDAGTNMVDIPATAFPQAGLYLWRLSAGDKSANGKVFKY